MKPSLPELRDTWAEAWPRALETWSKYTRIRPPQLCVSEKEAKAEGLDGSFAMIRLMDQAVVVSLPSVKANGVEDYALEVLAHEIGHHVLAPANLTDHARCIARMRRALPTIEAQAPMVANLYTDLLINDRLQRSSNLRMAEVYQRTSALEGKKAPPSAAWTPDDRMEGDAWLGARLVRSYARDWLDGSGRFAALLLPHLLEDKEAAAQRFAAMHDTKCAGVGAEPFGLTDEDPDERLGNIHPAADPELSGEEGSAGGKKDYVVAQPKEGAAPAMGSGQARQPFEYGEILRAAGITLSDHDVAVRYYRERAQPHIVPFPSREMPEGTDPLPEGLEPWDIGHPIDHADWLQSILISPRVVPGVTTVQRTWGTTEGALPKRLPFDLDLYVDSSGSMPNPQHLISYPALAGAILCLSALRAGARVQATLWSGKNDVTTTGGFVHDEEALVRVLTGFYGGGTQFPIHVLRETFAHRRADARPAHIMIVSDDGVSTLFDQDEKGNSGWEVAGRALAAAGGGGTMVLNLAGNWESFAKPRKEKSLYYDTGEAYSRIVRARDEQGWNVHQVATLEGLVAFARSFSRKHYGGPEKKGARA